MRLMRTLSTTVLAAALVVGCDDSTDPDDHGGAEQLDVSGTLVGNILSITFADFDQQCGGRMFTNTATVTSTTSGSTMSISFSASAMSVCPAISGTLTYTKQ